MECEMTFEDKFREELYTAFPEINRIKPNPYGWPIIQKWNYRIYEKNKHGLYNFLYPRIQEEIMETAKAFFKEFAEIST